MKRNRQALLMVFLLMLIGIRLYAQTWNGKAAAVVLTYDDALNVHLDNSIPLLDSLGMKATFYLSGYSGVVDKRIKDWRSIANNGHELGNHTLYHPCLGNKPGRDFVKADNDLSLYSYKRITDEIRMTNTLLKAIDGKTKRTFAYPCGDTKINDSLYLSPLKNEFVAARSTVGAMYDLNNINLFDVGCYSVNGQTGEQLIEQVAKAIAGKKLLVFLFHGVGGEHGLNVSLPAHRQLLQYLKAHEREIWIAPMVEVAEYIRQKNKS